MECFVIRFSASWNNVPEPFIYHKITTYVIITGFLTKLAVILCIFFDFPRQIFEGILYPKVLFETYFEN